MCIVPPAYLSVTFQPDREGTLYVGTPVILVCTVTVSANRMIVDTNFNVIIAYENLPSDTSRVTTSVVSTNATTYMGMVSFNFLLPSDRGVTYGCVSTLQPSTRTPFVDPVTNSTVMQIFNDIAGQLLYFLL